MSTWRKLGE